MLQKLKQKINSYIPKLTYDEPNAGNGFLIEIETDHEEDRCTKLKTCIRGHWRTYAWKGYKFIKPKKYIVSEKSTYRAGQEDYADVCYGFSFYKEGGQNLGLFTYYGVRENTLYGELKERWSLWNFPWKEWSFKYHHILDLNGNIILKETDNYKRTGDWLEQSRWKDKNWPTVTYNVVDKYDGEKIKATVKIEERCWTKGSKSFKWLKYFNKPRISRDMDISFDKEVGPKKGSWKGGTVGCGHEMNPGESIDHAFMRFCNERDMVIFGIQN